jgi:hypothetical protein
MNGMFHAIFWPVFWIGVWGIVALFRQRRRMAELTLLAQVPTVSDQEPTKTELSNLRERLNVLERITVDKRHSTAIAAEIEALRDK